MAGLRTEVLSGIQSKSVPWLWQPYLPIGMLAMLTGDPLGGENMVQFGGIC
jgi:hypothetical protein